MDPQLIFDAAICISCRAVEEWTGAGAEVGVGAGGVVVGGSERESSARLLFGFSFFYHHLSLH